MAWPIREFRFMSKQRSNFLISRLLKLLFLMLPIAIFLASMGFFILYTTSRSPQSDFFIVQENLPRDITEAFAYSLPFNRTDNMKSYVTEDKWEFLIEWKTTHEPISEQCRYPNDPDFWGHFIGVGDGNDKTTSGYIFYTYDCPDYSYHFVADLDLSLIEGQWQVMGWKKLCETKNGSERCWID